MVFFFLLSIKREHNSINKWIVKTQQCVLCCLIYLFYTQIHNSQHHTHWDRFRWHGHTVFHSDNVRTSLNIRLHTCCFDILKSMCVPFHVFLCIARVCQFVFLSALWIKYIKTTSYSLKLILLYQKCQSIRFLVWHKILLYIYMKLHGSVLFWDQCHTYLCHNLYIFELIKQWFPFLFFSDRNKLCHMDKLKKSLNHAGIKRRHF